MTTSPSSEETERYLLRRADVARERERVDSLRGRELVQGQKDLTVAVREEALELRLSSAAATLASALALKGDEQAAEALERARVGRRRGGEDARMIREPAYDGPTTKAAGRRVNAPGHGPGGNISMSTGIDTRHARTCGSRSGTRCDCTPTYQASTYDAQAQKKVRKSFKTISAAKRWRQDAAVALRAGELTAKRGPTLRAATDQWLADMEAGHERTRSGDTYKPSAIRGYRQSLTKRVLPTLGRHRIKEITARDVQALMDQLVRDGNAPATIDGALTPLRAFYRRALVRGEVPRNPTVGVIKPAVRSEPKAIAPPAEVAARLDTLDGEDRTLWALAFYSGLRRGEIIALRPADVNLAAGVIHVRRGWDMEHGEIKPKSQRGQRNVPVPAPLRDHLDQHLLDHGERERVFRSPRWVAKATDRAKQPWADAGLAPITLHVARHSYASLMIAAGVNAKALSAFMGHASIQTTFNLYGHLMPGSEAQAADLLDAFLARDAAALTGALTGAQEAQTLS